MIRHFKLFLILLFSLSLNCNSSENNEATIIEIEDNYPDAIAPADEQKIHDLLKEYSEQQYRATVLINSALLADMEHTSPDVVKARAEAAEQVMARINEICFEIIDFENNIIIPAVNAVETQAPQMINRPRYAGPNGDLFHAQKLVDLYLTNKEFGKKNKLSDIAKKTNVSMSRLRMMMGQVINEVESMGEDKIAASYGRGVRNVNAITASAAAVGAIAVVVGTGGIAAGGVGVLGKGAVIAANVSTTLTVAKGAVSVSNSISGTDHIPAVIRGSFAVNDVLSYLMIPSGVSSKETIDRVTVITSMIEEGTNQVMKLTTDDKIAILENGYYKIDMPPMTNTPEDTQKALLLPGTYKVPSKEIVPPTFENSGFEFTENLDVTDPVALQEEAADFADLLDLPSAITNEFSFNNEIENPDSSFISVSVEPLETTDPKANDPILSNPALASKVVGVDTDNNSGDTDNSSDTDSDTMSCDFEAVRACKDVITSELEACQNATETNLGGKICYRNFCEKEVACVMDNGTVCRFMDGTVQGLEYKASQCMIPIYNTCIDCLQSDLSEDEKTACTDTWETTRNNCMQL